jgi:hypothetical protein
MKKFMPFLFFFILLCSIVLLLLVVKAHAAGEWRPNDFSKLRVTVGMTHDAALGAEMPSGYTLYKADVGHAITHYFDFEGMYEGFYYDRELYLTALFQEGNQDEFAGGLGYRLRGGYAFTENWRLYLGAGLAVLPGAGDIQNLAHSVLYGTLEGGVEYRGIKLGLNHISSPFHGGDDGDSGTNDFYFGFAFNF